jgi:aldehyde dehydrogenase (NAD+)
LIGEIKNHIGKTYAPDKNSIEQSTDYGRIVNAKHFTRVKSLLSDAVEKGAEVAYGGNTNPETNYIEPTILKNVPLQAKVMQEEIFGPILPIVHYKNTEEAIIFINALPKALAMYIFGGSKTEKEQFLKKTSSGAVVINDCAVHFVQNNLPFGGVNNSGIGKSHGHYGFLAFSNEKAIMKQKHGFTSVGLFFPPYTSFVKKVMNWFLKFI